MEINKDLISEATTSSKGLMSASDKSKINGLDFVGVNTITKNSAYVGNLGWNWCYKNNQVCMLNLNFQIPTDLTTKDLTLFTGLPIPKQRITTGCFVGTGTPERLYIDTNGSLKTDSMPFEAGWVNFSIMYLLA